MKFEDIKQIYENVKDKTKEERKLRFRYQILEETLKNIHDSFEELEKLENSIQNKMEKIRKKIKG